MSRQAIFTVTLTKTSTTTIMVDYATKDGTATAPSDYTPAAGTLTFLPGQRVKNISVTVRDALPGSPKEQFTIVLSNPRNCQLGRKTGVMEFSVGPEAIKNGPLIKKGLITNAYHKEVGRGGYFHEFSGTSEGQSIAIEGAFLAWSVLNGGTEEEKAVAAWYKKVGQQLVDAMGDGSASGPMLRQPVPENPETITLLHWLFAARGDIPAQGINYSFEAVPSGGKIQIPRYVNGTHKGGADIYRIFQIFPATSQLLYTSPYSPSFDKTTPAGDTSIRIDVEPVGDSGSTHWTLSDNTVELTLPPEASTSVGRWVVVYGYNNAGTIKQGDAQEAFPMWTSIDPSYAACAPDTFRWFEYAMTVAAELDDRSGKSANWLKLRAALRRTAVRGQNISDLREIFQPLPNFPAIPAKGEPSGMFCYSSNPGAGTPPSDVLSAGGNVDWVGYKYWFRYGGSGKSSPTLTDLHHWNPDDATKLIPLDPGATEPKDPTDNVGRTAGIAAMKNGAISAKVPTTGPNTYVSYQYQVGRGINDTWRSGKPYQDPDQFLLVVSYGMEDDRAWGYTYNRSQFPYPYRRTEREYYISLSKSYDPTKRYVAKVTKTLSVVYNQWQKQYDGSWYNTGHEAEMHRTAFLYRVNGVRWDGQIDPRGSDTSSPFYANWAQYNSYMKTNFTPGRNICFELIPIEAFQRLDTTYVYPDVVWKNEGLTREPYLSWAKFPVPAANAANLLPRDAVIENFGMTWQPAESKLVPDWQPEAGIIFMRLLSGPSKQWVLDNLQKAVRGSAMPFFPGAMPFAINANVKNQQFVGFNGNPFHGYQLPDYWWFLQEDAQAIHPDLAVSDLPTAALSGALEYVISATTGAGVTKPKHALLAEQQLIFLIRAQDKWEADAGYRGPFAHTFVLNTPARATIGNPTPHTWVYTNDDPNTRWVGYQVRVVESLAKLVWLARSDAGWSTAVAQAKTMAMSWLVRLNVDWPDLSGKNYTDPILGPIKIYGMPTDYDNPATKGISTLYEEPHAASLILRASVWLQASGTLNAGELALVRALAKRCWDYLEMRWRTAEDDTMRYTWANTNATTREQYYGFWHFEIITTICHLISNPTTIPDGATVAQLRDRLVKTQSWTAKHTE